MKNPRVLQISFLVLLLVLGGIFMWLLNSATPDKATQQEIVIELPDTFEK